MDLSSYDKVHVHVFKEQRQALPRHAYVYNININDDEFNDVDLMYVMQA